MLVFLLVISPIVLLAIWAIVYDVKHRRAPLTDNNPRAVAKKVRIEGEGKSSEWGAGGGV
ncbi:hypothetical protein EV644_11371 [Kribbella orskensis]|uniref:Uncharacterized protein n=1 Tax=Kribbella orskensis TaxID=2512216 RepID=A0ABY2BEG3_9ACTN|nr:MULTISPECIES: hypothetical protein [Kribbella]TCN36602.1 hypothetical protein EV642_11470 [Kribbella sp. VKM Ac-2500]TCO17841.1 hypothetical protein EV644_11371 [Kribbella orskensis]